MYDANIQALTRSQGGSKGIGKSIVEALYENFHEFHPRRKGTNSGLVFQKEHVSISVHEQRAKSSLPRPH